MYLTALWTYPHAGRHALVGPAQEGTDRNFKVALAQWKTFNEELARYYLFRTKKPYE
jgi:hypothetical protein